MSGGRVSPFWVICPAAAGLLFRHVYVSPGTTLDLKVRMFFLLLVVEPLLDVKVDRN
jgi:hypothetical protein